MTPSNVLTLGNMPMLGGVRMLGDMPTTRPA